MLQKYMKMRKEMVVAFEEQYGYGELVMELVTKEVVPSDDSSMAYLLSRDVLSKGQVEHINARINSGGMIEGRELFVLLAPQEIVDEDDKECLLSGVCEMIEEAQKKGVEMIDDAKEAGKGVLKGALRAGGEAIQKMDKLLD